MEGRISQGMGRETVYSRNSFNEASLETSSTPPSQNPDSMQQYTNVMPARFGTIERRWGYTKPAGGGILPPSTGAVYVDEARRRKRLVFTFLGLQDAQAWSESFGTNITLTGINLNINGSIPNRMVNSRSYAYFTVDRKKWDGADVPVITTWGFDKPATAITIGATAAGSITIASGRKYFSCYYNTTTGHISDLSPVSASTGALAAQQQTINNIPTTPIADSGVDRVLILATADGGAQTTLYYLTDVALGTTTYVDNTPEATLLTNNIYLETIDGVEYGVADNSRPLPAILGIKHRGRIYLAVNFTGKGGTNPGTYLYYSKSAEECLSSTGVVTGRWEESFPALNFLDVSERAERVQALLSDGYTLFVGTDCNIRRIDGENPLSYDRNNSMVFSGVGVMNQECWRIATVDGSQIGTIWLTPDKRVILSNMVDAYIDVGAPIQDILDTIPDATAATNCNAEVVSMGGRDLYILSFGTTNNTYVLDLKTRTWAKWEMGKIKTQIYNVKHDGGVQWVFHESSSALNPWYVVAGPDYVDDDGRDITSTIQTAWIDFGDPQGRKLLNSMEVVTEDTAMIVTVEGASNAFEFTTPSSGGTFALSWSPLGELFVPLASTTTKDRFYRFKFVSTSNTIDKVLRGFSAKVIPIHNLV